MDKYCSSIRYHAVDEVPVREWRIQGTVYDNPVQAKYAAAKLFCTVKGVVVKRIRTGWTLMYLPYR